jgi:hypothetical protein
VDLHLDALEEALQSPLNTEVLGLVVERWRGGEVERKRRRRRGEAKVVL